ncbi:MAG: hypothetical protein ACI379_06710 [Nocardioides sp.]|uniref:hypothetical protein n=1 Tax=Nocardioides sp. TaxID=35761 RepID=UPI003F0822D0
MQYLDEFTRALYTAVPELPAAMRDEGEQAEPDHDIPTSWLGYLGGALATVLPRLSPEAAGQAFTVIERYLTRADDALSTGIATGLLESLANAVSRGRLEAPLLAGVLRPASRQYIDAWDELTLGRSSLESE